MFLNSIKNEGDEGGVEMIDVMGGNWDVMSVYV